MLVSSSSYPKLIYGMPLNAKDVQIRFEFEFKFKFEFKQKIKTKRKGKRKRPRPHGLASGEQGPASFSTAQVDRAHPARSAQPKKRKWACPLDRPMAISSPQPRAAEAPCFSEFAMTLNSEEKTALV